MSDSEPTEGRSWYRVRDESFVIKASDSVLQTTSHPHLRLLRTCQDFAFRYGVLDIPLGLWGLSETPRGSSLDEWAAAERVVVQFLALPVLPGAASTTSGPPRRAPSWRICAVQTDTGTPCCTRSGLVAHVDFGLAFDLRRREVLFRAGFELSESLGG